jgi:flagellin-like protein
MKFNQKRAVSPIIATLLLIAIAVAAGIIVYVYVNSLAGGLTGGGGGAQVSSQVELTAYNFNQLTGTPPTGNCATSGTGNAAPCAIIFVKNTGGSSVTVGDVYFDGAQLTETGTAFTMAPQVDYEFVLLHVVGTTPTCVTADTGDCFSGLPSSITAGTTHTVKIVESTGTVSVFSVTAGSSG